MGAPLSLLGEDGGYTAMLALAMLAFGALVWGVFLLGRESFGWPVGALAAFVVATRDPFLSQAVRAYVDIPFLALVVAAAVLEVRRPAPRAAGARAARRWPGCCARRRGCSAAPTGSTCCRDCRGGARLRARRAWSSRRRCCGRSATSPITGDPFHSLTFTRDTAETLGRPQGIENVPEIMPRRLGEILRWVPLVGGTAGFFLALRFARERALVPAALAVLGGLAFVAIGIAGLSLLGPLPVPAGRDAGRLLRLRGARLARAPARRRLRSLWIGGAAVLLIAFVGSTISHQTDRLDRLRDGIQLRGEIQDDLRDLTRERRRPSRCSSAARPVYVPEPPPRADPRLVPRPRRRATSSRRSSSGRVRGLYVAPANREVEEKFVLDPRDPKRFEAPAAGRVQAGGRERVVGALRARLLGVEKEWTVHPSSRTGPQACQPRCGSSQAVPRRIEKTA